MTSGGVVLPNYLAAGAAILGTAIAVVSLILAESARRRSQRTSAAEAATRAAVENAIEALEIQNRHEWRDGFYVPTNEPADVERAVALLTAARNSIRPTSS